MKERKERLTKTHKTLEKREKLTVHKHIIQWMRQPMLLSTLSHIAFHS